MKKIEAYIKPHKLSDVAMSLRDIPGMTGISVCDIKGFGRGRAVNSTPKIIEGLIAYMPMVKIEIMCADNIVDVLVTEIEKNAFTGLKGDGKIYVSEVIAAVRISTGERGHDAI